MAEPEALPAIVCWPLLERLLPEAITLCQAALRKSKPWEASAALLSGILASQRGRIALQHPAGVGRALWARRLAVPNDGALTVEDEDAARTIVLLARGAALSKGGDIEAQVGAFDDVELAQLQAKAAAGGRGVILLTSKQGAAKAQVELAGGGECIWALGPDPSQAQKYALAALEQGRENPAIAAEILNAGASSAFQAPIVPLATAAEREKLASVGARRALDWLRDAPAGLSVDELGALAEVGYETVFELERLRLAHRHRDVIWVADGVMRASSLRLWEIAERLPPDSPRGLAARAMANHEGAALEAWASDALAAGDAEAVLDVTRAVANLPGVALVAIEAALDCGRLWDAERLLESVPVDRRHPEYHVLAALWADAAGLPARAVAELAEIGDANLSPRLEARLEWVRAQSARRGGDAAGEVAALKRAVAITGQAGEAGLALALKAGPVGLRAWRRGLGTLWTGDLASRTLHALGIAAFERSAFTPAATALRAALRRATGRDLRLLGEIHADLGGIAVVSDQPALAERHLAAAQRLLEVAGSRRAVTIVKFNRGALACDRLRWREAEELIRASRALRGGTDDAGFWLEELELARSRLARGDAASVRADLHRLASGVARHRAHQPLQQALASVTAHAALAMGDSSNAEAAAAGAEEGERELIRAVVAAEKGIEPRRGLPHRWGMMLTAAVLAAWRAGNQQLASIRASEGLERWPLESAVGIARCAALIARNGRLPACLSELGGRVEGILETAELDGWARVMRESRGAGALPLLTALDAIVCAGSDALGESRLIAFARALDLSGLEVLANGRTLIHVGEFDDSTYTVTAGRIAIRAAGTIGETASFALGLLARFLSGAVGAEAEMPRAHGGLIVGSSPAMDAVRAEIARWAPLPVTVLIVGEPGTGKELLAKELHRASGRHGEFVPVNCAGIPAGLLEAELFGVTRGAFTGADRDRAGLVEAAEGGTLFLDEIGELPLELQGKLLRLLQEREVRRVGSVRSRTVDVRFVAATNRDIESLVGGGLMRQDLYYRLAVAVVRAPPLRERGDDVEEIAAHLAARWSAAFGRPGIRLAPASLALLRRAAWPGNVRELDAAVARAVGSARPNEVIGPDRFEGLLPGAGTAPELLSWDDAVTSFRRTYFTALLEACGGNRSEAARRAGISRQALLYHLKELGLGRSAARR